jgi:hypothetical protein
MLRFDCQPRTSLSSIFWQPLLGCHVFYSTPWRNLFLTLSFTDFIQFLCVRTTRTCCWWRHVFSTLVWSGDHRVFAVEVVASTLFRGAYPMIILPIQSVRLSDYEDKASVLQKTEMTQIVTIHNVSDKLKIISDLCTVVATYQYWWLHHKRDTEFRQFMILQEKKCNKCKSCCLEYSHTVWQWLKWHDEAECNSTVPSLLTQRKVGNMCNLVHLAQEHSIKSPLLIPKEEVEHWLVASRQHCLS